ncbi:hypothetical protein ACFWZ2_39845 [Streptomyces sp. NPDC059002]|uniref:hypothetical protein n=1 Tax=Streptomyces sp. NPDC059002 TaxID=3346690 RepID=UPI0036CDA035
MQFLREVVRSGYPQRLAALADGYCLTIDPDQVRAEARFLAGELAAFEIRHDPAYIEVMCAFRQLMIPVDDPALGRALTRSYLIPMLVDDECDESRTAYRGLETAMLKGVARPRHGLALVSSALHPQSAYTEHMFNELSRFCSPAFLSVRKAFYYQAFTGVVLESGYTPDARDDIDTEYVRRRSGYGEFFATALAVAYGCLDFERNIPLWGATLSSWVDFFNDINDLMSCYKETLGGEFPVNSIYRKAVQNGLPLMDSYEAAFRRGVANYHRIHDLGSSEQRPLLLHYLQGYVHWHLTSDRYRWGEFTALT